MCRKERRLSSKGVRRLEVSKLYGSPLRVYLLLGTLALVGIYCGFKLPVSLFPNSSKPTVYVSIPYGNHTAEEFLNSHGGRMEDQLRRLVSDRVEIEKLKAHYESHSAEYEVEFRWGTPPLVAKSAVEVAVNAYSSRLSEESRNGVGIGLNYKNIGFLAVSFFSETRSLDGLYDFLEPILMGRVSRVTEAAESVLFNPSRKDIRIELIPDVIAALQIFPKDIEQAIASVQDSRSGGFVTSGIRRYPIQMARQAVTLEDLGRVNIQTPSGKSVHLSDIARINLAVKTTQGRSFKTSGTPSLILWATPRPGGNVKKMAEDILRVIAETMPSLPKDIQYRILVDPSEFIRSAVRNVFHEVAIGAFLAVMILFLFIGSFRNVVTAAIEIPISMVLAFLLMHLSGINLNLISLGGLALSAGMNVDASVVVMENIFRHFDKNGGVSRPFASRLQIISDAVKEVRFAVIASTISSVVVFLPLLFTSDLSHAILGDLAKTVVFSHSFSAIVALILVPTVRLQLMSVEKEQLPHPPIESQLKWLENWYTKALGPFIQSPRLKWGCYGILVILLGVFFVFLLPRIPKEIVGIPDTDWIFLNARTEGNTLVRQMEVQAEEIEAQLISQFDDKIQYTFNQVNGPNEAIILSRLKNKKDTKTVWKALEKRFGNTPLLKFRVAPWNPSELPIPDPPHLRISVRGGETEARAELAREIHWMLEEKKVFPRLWTEPNIHREQAVVLEPHMEQWDGLRKRGIRINPSDLSDLVRVATEGRIVDTLPIKERMLDIMLHFPANSVSSPEDIGSLPVGVGSKIIPLKALASVRIKRVPSTLYREDGRELTLIEAKENMDEKYKAKASEVKAKQLVETWMKGAANAMAPTVVFEDPAKELNEALDQLVVAVALSVVLIFLTLLLQFGNFVEALLILVAVPLGFMGVLLSLFIFQSTLSLNSVLGIILLNGIAVANSILLVDFTRRLVKEGLAPSLAALEAARKRLRPILITSLTTILAMLPIAFGFGEGGKILQPLGIAVSGGLWVSTLLTLFLVPALHVSYLEWRALPHRERTLAFLPKIKFRLPMPSQANLTETDRVL